MGSEATEPLNLGQVLLVFFVPLAAAAAVVIWSLRYLPGLAGRPGVLALVALTVAVLSIVLAKVLTRRPRVTCEDKREYGC